MGTPELKYEIQVHERIADFIIVYPKVNKFIKCVRNSRSRSPLNKMNRLAYTGLMWIYCARVSIYHTGLC